MNKLTSNKKLELKCNICYEDLVLSKIKIHKNCRNFHSFCKSCIVRYNCCVMCDPLKINNKYNIDEYEYEDIDINNYEYEYIDINNYEYEDIDINDEYEYEYEDIDINNDEYEYEDINFNETNIFNQISNYENDIQQNNERINFSFNELNNELNINEINLPINNELNNELNINEINLPINNELNIIETYNNFRNGINRNNIYHSSFSSFSSLFDDGSNESTNYSGFDRYELNEDETNYIYNRFDKIYMNRQINDELNKICIKCNEFKDILNNKICLDCDDKSFKCRLCDNLTKYHKYCKSCKDYIFIIFTEYSKKNKFITFKKFISQSKFINCIKCEFRVSLIELNNDNDNINNNICEKHFLELINNPLSCIECKNNLSNVSVISDCVKNMNYCKNHCQYCSICNVFINKLLPKQTINSSLIFCDNHSYLKCILNDCNNKKLFNGINYNNNETYYNYCYFHINKCRICNIICDDLYCKNHNKCSKCNLIKLTLPNSNIKDSKVNNFCFKCINSIISKCKNNSCSSLILDKNTYCNDCIIEYKCRICNSITNRLNYKGPENNYICNCCKTKIISKN